MLEQVCGRQLGKRKNLERMAPRVSKSSGAALAASVRSGHGRPTWSEERRVHAYGAQPASSVRWSCYLVAGAAFTEIASAST
jgi:hypothetical protein